MSATDSLEEGGVSIGLGLLPEGARVDLPAAIQASLEDFADLTGLAVELLDVGEEGSAVDVLALSCAALREAVEALRERLGTPVLPAIVPPLAELARILGAEGLYRIAFTAASLALGDPSGRLVLESFLESAGVSGVRQLSDADVAASVFAYLAVSLGAMLSRA